MVERTLENTFIIEVCENCRTHNWNTRHDENKYKNYALESKCAQRGEIPPTPPNQEWPENNVCIFRIVAQKIQENSPGILVLINEVPKAWVDFEIYCQLIPNNDASLKTFKILPRIGAFEVSFKGVVSFVFNDK